MKITERQLRQIIKEEKARVLAERANPALVEIESVLRRNLVEYIDTYTMTLGMNPGDPADQRRIRLKIDDMISAVIG
jgi:hypothetical protein